MQAATATAPADAAASPDRQATFTRHALRNVRIISYSYLLDGALLCLYVLAGTVTWPPVLTYVVMGLVVGTFWTTVFRHGWTLHCRDPLMPMTMSLTHQVLQLVGMLLMPQLSFVFLLVLFVVFTSLAMRVALRQATTACISICVGAGLVLWFNPGATRIPDAQPFEQLLACGFVSLTLWRCIWIGSYNSTMTATLRRRSRELADLTRRVQQLAEHDELTGLLNRRSLLAALDDELRRADRTGQPLAIALLDLDHFKAINDTHGHAAGDRTLKLFAQRVMPLVRTTDRFGRYGGEEFVIVMSGTTAEEAVVPIDRFRAALAARGWDDIVDGLRVTFSAGLAGHRPGETAEDLLRRADTALYAAKDAGRNCTRHA